MLEKILEREREDLQKEREDNRKEKQRRQNMGTIIVGTLRHVKQRVRVKGYGETCISVWPLLITNNHTCANNII
ncbi:unnamed protein product [Spirodela intermedia]|uniref:Uncharacterized protein n=1 Tax=Spirodela intermedia TaxID=51605 RepID=A0A7I8IM15_SPIIN|nr:unnamed protein product [Spirodela intermedia]CAA6658478.1 unnamed protein product [Spirodela intermedia]